MCFFVLNVRVFKIVQLIAFTSLMYLMNVHILKPVFLMNVHNLVKGIFLLFLYNLLLFIIYVKYHN